ncbi:Glycerate kinase [Cyphellophora attinorum]|uniref:Glycerate kinase n=1 Tax=Cyphellophora attinorum TaxID=1664694 RepID=A0A0N1NWN3_9EURO|nr:Glycerate kinase [Phialophora attinorum]KPI35583.1 Glycerate kinase [Phialophora attinorum]
MASIIKVVPAMNIVIAPSGFKESLDPVQAAECIEKGILKVAPNSKILKMPLVDGGEGFVHGLVSATKGRVINITVTGPLGLPIPSYFGFRGDRPATAIIEMAAAAGLSLVPRDQRDPTRTTSFGVGELILAAIEAGATKILVGCGDSGVCDAGIGMLQALGVRYLDGNGQALPQASGIEGLERLSVIDTSTLNPLLSRVKIDVACNWHNVLCGPKGVSRVFGPQKGATDAQVEAMSIAMERCAEAMSRILGRDISLEPGTGASGGLGAGLLLTGATLHPRYDIVMRFFDIDRAMKAADLVITAEGGIDEQTPRGKIPAEVASRAKSLNLPVIALAGTIGAGAEANYHCGIDAFASIMQGPTTLDVAIAQAKELLTDAAESSMRMVLVGQRIRKTSETLVEPPCRSKATN